MLDISQMEKRVFETDVIISINANDLMDNTRKENRTTS